MFKTRSVDHFLSKTLTPPCGSRVPTSFTILEKNRNSNFRCHIWNQREKCIKMSTNKPSIGSEVSELEPLIWGKSFKMFTFVHNFFQPTNIQSIKARSVDYFLSKTLSDYVSNPSIDLMVYMIR